MKLVFLPPFYYSTANDISFAFSFSVWSLADYLKSRLAAFESSSCCTEIYRLRVKLRYLSLFPITEPQM